MPTTDNPTPQNQAENQASSPADNSNNSLISQFTNAHWAVIGSGLAIFIALFFVNKTPPLDNKKDNKSAETKGGANRDANTQNNPNSNNNTGSSQAPLGLNDLPETTPEQKKLADLLAQYNKEADSNANPKSTLATLEAIVTEATGNGRTDYAAIYQEKLFAVQPTDSALKKAAQLTKRAAEMYQSENRAELFEKARLKSIALYDQYLQKNTNDIDAKIDQATLHVESPTPMAGIQALVKIANDNPQNYRAQLELGIFSLRTNQTPKAIERLKKVVALAPNKWEGHFYLGMAFKQAGKAGEAKAAFQKAASLNTNEVIKNEIEIQLKELS